MPFYSVGAVGKWRNERHDNVVLTAGSTLRVPDFTSLPSAPITSTFVVDKSISSEKFKRNSPGGGIAMALSPGVADTSSVWAKTAVDALASPAMLAATATLRNPDLDI